MKGVRLLPIHDPCRRPSRVGYVVYVRGAPVAVATLAESWDGENGWRVIDLRDQTLSVLPGSKLSDVVEHLGFGGGS